MIEFTAIDRLGNETIFVLKEASHGDERGSEMQYRIAYSHAIREGILPREAMREALKKAEIWSDEQEEEFQQVTRDVAVTELRLKREIQAGSKEDSTETAKTLAKHRTRLWELFIVQQSAYLNSCEGYAEIIRQEALMSSCVIVKQTNQRYWENYTEYVRERDENENATVAAAAMEANLGILNSERNEMVAAYPENEWLESVKKTMLESIVTDEKKKQDGEGVETSSEGSEGDDQKAREEGVAPSTDGSSEAVD